MGHTELHEIVPAYGKKKLTEADRLPISQGLHTFLSRYGCVVKPEQVSEQIVNAASALFWCESVERKMDHCCAVLAASLSMCLASIVMAGLC